MGFAGVFVLTLLLVGGAMSGCGSTASEPPIDCTKGCWEPTPEDEALAADLCTHVEACCIANEARETADIEGCKAAFLHAGLSRDPSVRAACLADLQRLAASTPHCFPDVGDLTHACQRLVYEPSGPQRPGEPCVQRADCAGNAGAITLCSPDPTRGRPGGSPTGKICLRLERGRPGDTPCLGHVLQNGTVAAVSYAYPIVDPRPVASGVVCEARAGLYCGPGDNPPYDSCLPLIEDGASCEHSVTCQSRECRTETGGDPSSLNPGICTPRVPPGQPCNGSPRTICDDTGYCQSTDDGTSICRAKHPDGSACEWDGMCLSGTCDPDTKLCVTRPKEPDTTAIFGFCSRL